MQFLAQTAFEVYNVSVRLLEHGGNLAPGSRHRRTRYGDKWEPACVALRAATSYLLAAVAVYSVVALRPSPIWPRVYQTDTAKLNRISFTPLGLLSFVTSV